MPASKTDALMMFCTAWWSTAASD